VKKQRTEEELQAIKASWYVDDNSSIRWARKANGGKHIGDLVGMSNVSGGHRICLLTINRKLIPFVESNVIWFLRNNNWAESEIDHIDGNPLNNSIDNMRLASRSENCCNTALRSDNKTGYKGIYPRYGKWSVQIWKDKKCHNLGIYETIEEAIAIRVMGLNKLHGAFALMGVR
jgi:hypothetical protein